MLKTVLNIDSARPAPLEGDDWMGLDRFWQTRGRNMFKFGDCFMRWTRRLYAAMNSEWLTVSKVYKPILGLAHPSLALDSAPDSPSLAS